MPRVPVPPEVDEFLAQPRAAVIATLRPDGSPHTAATWYDWDDGRVLLNMDESRVRLGYMRRDPRASKSFRTIQNMRPKRLHLIILKSLERRSVA